MQRVSQKPSIDAGICLWAHARIVTVVDANPLWFYAGCRSTNIFGLHGGKYSRDVCESWREGGAARHKPRFLHQRASTWLRQQIHDRVHVTFTPLSWQRRPRAVTEHPSDRSEASIMGAGRPDRFVAHGLAALCEQTKTTSHGKDESSLTP